MAEAWPLPCFGNCLSVWGFGRIAATLDAIEGYEREQFENWKHEGRT
jgi:hypothetical protein